MKSFQATIKQIVHRVIGISKEIYCFAKTFVYANFSTKKTKTQFIENADDAYARAFKQCFTDLANEVYGNTDPFDIAQRVLRATCEFYDADWCGMFDADMMLDLWMPFWWYNRETGGMT